MRDFLSAPTKIFKNEIYFIKSVILNVIVLRTYFIFLVLN